MGLQTPPSPRRRDPAPDIPRSDVDPFSDEFFEDPHRIHTVLRNAGPVVWLDRWDLYAVARYAEVRHVLTDWQTFCSGRGVGMSDFAKETPWRPPSLVLETDPPQHDHARAVLNKVLAPGVLRGLRTTLDQAAETLVDRLLSLGSFDGIADLAEAFPLAVFPDAVGLGCEGRENLLPFAAMAFNAFGPPNELRRKALEAAKPTLAWVMAQCQREALAPGGFGAAIHACVDEGMITAAEAPLLVRSLLTAGIDTTVNGIGAALYCLARFPEAWAQLRDKPALARAAFEEAIRYESPVQTFFRTTTRDAEVSGCLIPEGSKVLMFLGAANRDERHWDAPDHYSLTRHTTGHVGYGAGIHMCVGQLLARVEGEAILTALARRVDTLTLSGPVTRRYNNTLRGLGHLPLTVTRSATR